MDLEKTQNSEKIEESNENLPQNKVPSDTSNIFAELSWELDFGENKEEKIEIKKDKIYYLKLYWVVFWYVNIFVLVIVVILYSFLSIQNNSSLYSKSYLDPFCFILLSDEMKNTGDYCSSVSGLLQDYNTKTSTFKSEVVKKISTSINDIYSIENFTNSKEVTFLLDSKASRLKVLNMLNDFDNLKNDFTWMDKKRIICNQITISNDSTMDISCDINSSSWEVSDWNWNWIIWYSWDRKNQLIEWTSVTIASSFLNFIEKNPEYNFQLIEKPKSFSIESVVWEETSYVKKTTIRFKLKYNNIKNNLSL